MPSEEMTVVNSVSSSGIGSLWRFLWIWPVILLLGGGGLWVWNTTQNTNYGSIVTPAAIEETGSDVSKSRILYSGKYFTFTHLENFKQREATTTVNYPLLERILLSEDTVWGRKLVVLYQVTDGSRPEEYAAWRIRHSNPNQYFEETIEKRGYRVTLFTKVEPVFEVTAFLPHGRQVLSISVTSPLGLSGLREELFEALDSLNFLTE